MRFLLFVGGWSFGGLETAYLSLMKGLRARGHEPVAIVCGWTDGIVPELLEQAGMPYHQVRLGRLYLTQSLFTWHTLWRMPAARWHLRRLFGGLRPDWVIYSEPQMALMTRHLLPTKRAMYLQAEPGRLMHHGWSRPRSSADRSASSASPTSSPAACRSIGQDAVVHNGVELREPLAPSRERRCASASSAGSTSASSTWCCSKPASLLKARPPALRSRHRRREEPATTRARSRRDRAALASAIVVRWIGFVADRDVLYGALDILAAPAIDEPFGLTVPEAGASAYRWWRRAPAPFPEIVRTRSPA